MAKFHGRIGFVQTAETSQGVWEETIVWRSYYGDFIRNARRWQNGERLNDNLTVSNQISIIADSYAIVNLGVIRCIELGDSKWKVTDISIEHPRLVLTIGGLYHGNERQAP